MIALATFLIGIIFLVIGVTIKTKVHFDAKQFLPPKFNNEYDSRCALGYFIFSPPMPHNLQKKFMVSQILACIGAVKITVFFVLISRYREAIFFGAVAFAWVVASLVASNKYWKANAIRRDNH